MARKAARDFPIWKHPNGQWCKKIKGRNHYFGTEKQAALERCLAERDFLLAGQPVPTNGLQVRDVLNAFHRSKQQANEEGRLADRSFREYEAVCDTLADTLGRDRDFKLLAPADLDRLRRRLIASKSGGVISPSSQKRLLGTARSVFYFANEELGASIRYKTSLRSPRASRYARHETGERLFSAADIVKLLDGASAPLRAMIYLGINCGFGNRDCATLPIEQVDLARGWHTYWRPKTETPRRCPLWEETSTALYDLIGNRTSGHVFLTSRGNPWFSDRGCPVTGEFRKLCLAAGVYRPNVTTFYTLRRTHYTIGAMAGEPAASQFIMGHTPASGDMGAIYRQRHFDSALRKVTDAIRSWLVEPVEGLGNFVFLSSDAESLHLHAETTRLQSRPTASNGFHDCGVFR